MKLDRKEFVKALESVMPGTSARSIVVGAFSVTFFSKISASRVFM